jgi:lipopolysaccharide export system protein LptC
MPRFDRSLRSRWVRRLKIGLPLIALAMLSALFLWPRDSGFDGGLVYSAADLLALGEGMTVSNPRFTGSTEAGEPFQVRADSATPDGPDPASVALDAVEAELDQTDGREVRLTAEEGELRPKDNMLSLQGKVAIRTSDGYVVQTDRVIADLRSRTVSAPGPVRAEGPRGAIEAGSFRAARIEAADERAEGAERLAPGDYFWFENRVKVRFAPAQGDG